MLKEITLNEFILHLQAVCNSVGNHRLKSIGATSDGYYSLHLESENGEKFIRHIPSFEK